MRSPLRVRAAMVVMPPPRVSAVGDASYELVHLPSADGSVPAVVFSGGANPACVFVFLPGIMGNLDVPGVGEASCDLGLDRWASPSGRGSMFARLASELASGEDAPVAPWAPRDRRSAFHAKKARASSAATRETRTRRFRAACALVSWRASEDETAAGIAAGIAEGDDDDSVAARRLALAVEDACAVAAHLRRNARSARSGGGAPRVASSGSGSAPSAGRRRATRRARGRRRRVRVGRARRTRAAEAMRLDTPGAIRAMALVPKLWVHGVADASVAPSASRAGFELAAEPKCAAFVVGGEHRLDIAREAAYAPMKAFAESTLTSEYLSSVGCDAPFGVELGNARRAATPCTGARVLAMPAAMRSGALHDTRESERNAGKKNHRSFSKAARTYDARLMFEVLKGGDVPVLGAGWVDVSEALGAGHAEAARLLMDAAIDAGARSETRILA